VGVCGGAVRTPIKPDPQTGRLEGRFPFHSFPSQSSPRTTGFFFWPPVLSPLNQSRVVRVLFEVPKSIFFPSYQFLRFFSLRRAFPFLHHPLWRSFALWLKSRVEIFRTAIFASGPPPPRGTFCFVVLIWCFVRPPGPLFFFLFAIPPRIDT